jgi:murein DD-endopeptidase MepM/ murein hydrolase activator NlpD
MIAHGQGLDGKSYVTLYAHAQVIRVKAKEYVQQGQHIADVGSTGYSTGPHLHFEVRVDGKHTDPMDFFD